MRSQSLHDEGTSLLDCLQRLLLHDADVYLLQICAEAKAEELKSKFRERAVSLYCSTVLLIVLAQNVDSKASLDFLLDLMPCAAITPVLLLSTSVLLVYLRISTLFLKHHLDLWYRRSWKWGRRW